MYVTSYTQTNWALASTLVLAKQSSTSQFKSVLATKVPFVYGKQNWNKYCRYQDIKELSKVSCYQLQYISSKKMNGNNSLSELKP